MRVLIIVASLMVTMHLATAQFPRPDHTDHARLARWLVHSNKWGSLATKAPDGRPAVGVVSFSDGPLDQASGRLFFYLTPMDETTQNIQRVDASCSLSISEAQLGAQTCTDTDPEDPTCARISVVGTMKEVTRGPDVDAAAQALFSTHPVMQAWPLDHGFTFFELHVREIHMLSWYGGMAIITAEDYFAADLTDATEVLKADDKQVGQQQWKPRQQQPQPRMRPMGLLTLQ